MAAPQGVTYQVEVQGMEAVLARIPGEVKRRRVAARILRKITLAIEGQAKVNVRKRTGNTARDVHSEVNEELGIGYVGTTGKVGRFLEFGTGLFGPIPHRIFPKFAKALAWPMGASGPGMQRTDMGLTAFMSGGVKYSANVKKTLRLTGQHTAAHAASGSAAMQYARSIAGMHKQPFLMPAYDRVLPLIPVIIEAEAVALFTPGLGQGVA